MPDDEREVSWKPTAAVFAFIVVTGLLIAIGIARLNVEGKDVVSQPDPAEQRVVPQRGIGPIRLGMSSAAVENRFGPADHERHATDAATGSAVTVWTYDLHALRVELRLVRGRIRVASLALTDRVTAERQALGIGSTEDSLRSRLPGLRCAPIGSRARGRCSLGSGEPGTRQTVFSLRDGRVASVVISFVRN
jgi:hypothetical protein